MKLKLISSPNYVAHIRLYKGIDVRSKNKDHQRTAYLFSLKKEFVIKNNLKYVQLFLDEDDPQKKYLYLKVVKEHDQKAVEIYKSGKSFRLPGISIVTPILNGSDEAFLFFHRKQVDGNIPMLVFEIERTKK